MRLKWIKINGFKEDERVVELNFSSEQASVIYGENGCGKTSLLRVIHAILTKDEDILASEDVKNLELAVTDENNSEIHVKVDRLEMKYENDEYSQIPIKNKYKWDEFDNTSISEMSSILFGVNRGITIKSEILPEQIERYFMTIGRYNRNIVGSSLWRLCEDLSVYLNKNSSRRMAVSRRSNQLRRKNSLLDKIDMSVIESLIYNTYKEAQFTRMENIKSVLVETLSDVIYPSENKVNNVEKIPNEFPELLQDNRQKLLEVLSLNNDDLFQKNIIKILRQNDLEKIIKECNENNILLNLLIKLIEILQKDSQIESINKLVQIFNEQINQRKKLVVNDEGVYIEFNDSRNKHGIEMLSSGEKQLLTLLSVLIVEGSKRDVVMIDEPELSLNLKWQREILDIFCKIAPNTQIIVASHSSALSRRNTKYLVKMKY